MDLARLLQQDSAFEQAGHKPPLPDDSLRRQLALGGFEQECFSFSLQLPSQAHQAAAEECVFVETQEEGSAATVSIAKSRQERQPLYKAAAGKKEGGQKRKLQPVDIEQGRNLLVNYQAGDCRLREGHVGGGRTNGTGDELDPYFRDFVEVGARAMVVRECESLKGTKFSLRRGKEVSILRELKGRYVQVQFRGLLGLFSKQNFALC